MKNLTAPPLYTSGYPLMSLPPQKLKMQTAQLTVTESRVKAKAPLAKTPPIADSPINWDESWFGNYE
ncbi:MAG: hypothetical protein V4676_03575 [Bacteroidota bacterium]